MDTASPDVTEAPLVLIVEDDAATRALYREGLHQAGFRVIEAHNGLQALDKARAEQPQVVLTDVAVPGMDGFEFGRALRRLDPGSTIPILAVTGRSEYLDEPERFRHAGIARVLLKPCDADRLARELRELLDQHSPARMRTDERTPV
jgi:CheY-like chemotaxis protein